MTMRTWSFYDPADGRIASLHVVGDRDAADEACPPTLVPMEGMLDHRSQRIDIATGVPVDWRPPAPSDSDRVTWHWCDEQRQWMPHLTALALAEHDARYGRTERDRRLAACDWIVARSAERGEPVPEPWRVYRQALRDITSQPGWPTDITWPTPPA